MFKSHRNSKGYYDAHENQITPEMIRHMFEAYLQCSLMGLSKKTLSPFVVPVRSERDGTWSYNQRLFNPSRNIPHNDLIQNQYYNYNHYLSALPSYAGFGLSTKPNEISAIHTGGFFGKDPQEWEFFGKRKLHMHNFCSIIGHSFDEYIKPRDLHT